MEKDNIKGTSTQDVSKGTESAHDAAEESSKKWAEGKPAAKSSYRLVTGKHSRFEGPAKTPQAQNKTYGVGDTIELTDEEAAALNKRGTRLEPLSAEEAEKRAEAQAQVEFKQAQVRSAARDESGYSPVGPPGGAGGPGTPNEPVGGAPGKPGGPPLGRRVKPSQPIAEPQPPDHISGGPVEPGGGTKPVEPAEPKK